ncbi:hypothetical protein [Streptomyces sp. NPDC050164]|uniref:hypothetical protein n=1 Tax=Streptomyces sp. NPDC050164 TaxID=3365605 RepID=UPI00379FB8F4
MHATDGSTRVHDVLEHIRMVPDQYREFTVSAPDLLRLYRIGPPLLDQLLDGGLPHDGSGNDRRFDPLDAENIGLGLSIGPRWRIMRGWSESLVRHDHLGTRSGYRVNLTAACPAPGHHGPCDFALDPALTADLAPDELCRVEPGSYAWTLAPARDPFYFPAQFNELINAATKLRFHLLPQELTSDLEFLRTTGLADCKLATAYLVQRSRELGINSRPRGGLFVSVPFPVWHGWVELHTDSGWYPADPFLLGALTRWGITDAAQWPPKRSTHGLVLPVDSSRLRVTCRAVEPATSRLRIAGVSYLKPHRRPT